MAEDVAPSEAPSEMTLPDWSDAASLQEWDLVDEHFVEKPQTPGGLMNRTIARSPRKVGDWKSASYALVRETEEEFAAVTELLGSIARRNTTCDAKVKAAELAVNTAMRERVTETQRLQDRLAEQIERTQTDIEQVEAARLALQTSL